MIRPALIAALLLAVLAGTAEARRDRYVSREGLLSTQITKNGRPYAVCRKGLLSTTCTVRR